ncbi:MAG: response regulator [Elusimicrobiota bacterium]
MAASKKILVADDDADLLGIVEFYLKKQGYDVTTVTDGREAIDEALRGGYGLLLFDVMMPKVDGYHVAQELSEKLGPDCPKILLMTSRDTEKEGRIAAASGADGILQKPLKLVELKSRVQQALDS